MKNLILFAFFAVSVTIFLVACSNDNDNDVITNVEERKYCRGCLIPDSIYNDTLNRDSLINQDTLDYKDSLVVGKDTSTNYDSLRILDSLFNN